MPFPLIPLIAAAGTAAGAWLSNRGNKQQAKEQMQFQERMSNTAAQRSVDDYRKAGLNPALAYDRSASSPGGAAAQIGDVLGPAVTSAANAARTKQDMQIAREMQGNQNMLMKEQAGAAKAANAAQTAAANKTDAEMWEVRQRMQYNQQLHPKIMQQMDVNNRATLAGAMLNEYGIPGARNAAALEQMLGKWSPGLKLGGQLLGDAVSLGRGGAAIFEAIKRGTKPNGPINIIKR